MACYYPTPALHDPATGAVTLWPPVGSANVELPCGSCDGCKTDRALEWARRAHHEAAMWRHNCFLTLTYKDEELPSDGLVPEHLSAFLKRLREHHRRRHPAIAAQPGGLRYLACGEYGDRTHRPHYHLCLFNCSFNDTYRVSADLYESRFLNTAWTAGHHRLGSLTAASANYVAQYTMKKIGVTQCDADGVVIPAPFLRASTKPPIGATWLKKYKRDAIHGFLVWNGTPGRVPRTYLRVLQREDPQLAEEIKYRAQQGTAKQRRASGADASALTRLQTATAGLSDQQKEQQQQRQRILDELAARREAGATIHARRKTLHQERTL